MDCLRIASFFIYLILAALTARGIAGTDGKQGLPENYRSLSSRISSSGEPVADAAFAALAEAGVKTVVSVDGATPDVASAERHGLRYVHLPIGYDGVPAATIAALGKLLAETEGRVLVHCHHGQHRGPAAAVIACMIEGSMNKDQALATLKAVGTSADYAGLWRDVKDFTGLSREVTAAPLRSKTDVEPLAADMVGIDRAFDAVTRLSKANGGSGVDAIRSTELTKEQCVLLVEGFREAGRHVSESEPKRNEIREHLENSLQSSTAILRAAQSGDSRIVADSIAHLKDDCRTCHRKFRD